MTILNTALNDWSRGKQLILSRDHNRIMICWFVSLESSQYFPRAPPRETWRFSGNKINCFPRDQSLRVYYYTHNCTTKAFTWVGYRYQGDAMGSRFQGGDPVFKKSGTQIDANKVYFVIVWTRSFLINFHLWL